MLDLKRRVVAEAIGTAFLLAAVVGSGIMGERLSGGNAAVALLVNTIATGTALVALIYSFAPISGAHFNPVVTLALASRFRFGWSEVPYYLAAQMVGAVAGIIGAHGMFGEPAIFWSHHARTGAPQLLSEFIATFGLILVIWSSSRYRLNAVSLVVGAYITAAYWFTSSTSFANPAVTFARMMSDTFTGIRPADVPGFIAAQILGAGAATLLARWMLPHEEKLSSTEDPV
jgi:glycerol uptake facilitator-like aquaporin